MTGSVPRYATQPVVPTPEYVPCVVCGNAQGHPDDGRCWFCLLKHLDAEDHARKLDAETERRHAEQAAWEASLPPRYDTAAEMAREMGEGE